MDSIVPFLFLCAFVLPTAIGIGLALLLQRSLGTRAYIIGWLAPLILLIGLYVALDLWTRATPCEPAGSLACGEGGAYALILFVGILCLTASANTIAQVVLFLLFRRQRQAQALMRGMGR